MQFPNSYTSKSDHGFEELLAREDKLLDTINASDGPTVFPFNKTNGYLIDTVPDEVLAIIDYHMLGPGELVPKHNTLAGNIAKEYALPVDTEVENYLTWLGEMYFKAFPESLSHANQTAAQDVNKPSDLEVFSLWVNWMERYEFNPPHTHSGKLSFVIWRTIPYTLRNEMLQSPCQRLDEANLAGAFQFIYPTYTEEGIAKATIRADVRYEKKICMFPSYLNHCVFPFYSSAEKRVSVAGNLRMK